MVIQEEDVIAFYERYDLYPGIECNLHDYLIVTFAALERSRSFGLFVRESLQETEHNVFRLNVDSWEELHNYYCSFMVGYAGNKS